MRRTLSMCILAVLAAFVVFLACPPKTEVVKIGYQKTEVYQHFFAAVGQGYFKSEGLQVEPVEFASANQMAEALIAGRIDATGTSAFPVLFSVEQNSPSQFKLYLVSVLTGENFPDYVIVKKGSKLASLADLKGKKLGTYPGSTLLTYAKQILKRFMDPEKDVQIVQLKPEVQLQALETGQVDAVFALEPIPSLGVTRGVAQVLEEAPLAKYVMDPMPGNASAFSARFAKERPRVAERVKRAMYRGADFVSAAENAAESKRMIEKWTAMDPGVIDKLRPPKYWKLDEIDKAAVQKLADLLLAGGALDKAVSTAGVYYTGK
ncbi:transporter substrate-binding domain-containing protein [candidate division WOR-3 bacterium]|uniref:Transporter substrate-binding domain-containing protein n=1 Tax=candidate division WOR-3 bacterium TaxID=2052148 RepID=A0A938BUJ0_UNCW3|nr:transporter substrate-binding domain-containing protein [candidate division WOR-3 bacterium]